MKQERLILKCDGLLKNKNVPKYVMQLLKEKYPSHIIMSKNNLFSYDLDQWCHNCLVMLFLI